VAGDGTVRLTTVLLKPITSILPVVPKFRELFSTDVALNVLHVNTRLFKLTVPPKIVKLLHTGLNPDATVNDDDLAKTLSDGPGLPDIGT
jgi:hypothetical protein